MAQKQSKNQKYGRNSRSNSSKLQSYRTAKNKRMNIERAIKLGDKRAGVPLLTSDYTPNKEKRAQRKAAAHEAHLRLLKELSIKQKRPVSIDVVVFTVPSKGTPQPKSGSVIDKILKNRCRGADPKCSWVTIL